MSTTKLETIRTIQELSSIPYPAFRKIPRLNRDVVITEKIDGTNALIFIDGEGGISAGSRTKWITPESDNFGFAAWVRDCSSILLELGPGFHYGEWWGHGIQRNYGLPKGERRFSLFNTNRWHGHNEEPCQNGFVTVNGRRDETQPTFTKRAPGCCTVVPVLDRGVFDTERVRWVLGVLMSTGSKAMPGFPKPEGIIVYHEAGGNYFKVLTENDDKAKGAE